MCVWGWGGGEGLRGDSWGGDIKRNSQSKEEYFTGENVQHLKRWKGSLRWCTSGDMWMEQDVQSGEVGNWNREGKGIQRNTCLCVCAMGCEGQRGWGQAI